MKKTLSRNVYLLAAVILFLGNSCADKKDHLVTIETKYGDMKLILFDDTPIHKQNFIELAESGSFDSTIFHRVMKGFMVQGGDIERINPELAKGKKPLEKEFLEKYHHKRGALAAARQPDNINPNKASSWSQFYIVQGEKFPREQIAYDQGKMRQYFMEFMNLESNSGLREELTELYQSGDNDKYMERVMSLVPTIEEKFNVNLKKSYTEQQLIDYETIGGAPHLDNDYTVFGEVIDGIEIVDSIADQPVGGGNKPFEDIFMKVYVEEVSKKKITKEYGYQYPEEE